MLRAIATPVSLLLKDARLGGTLSPLYAALVRLAPGAMVLVGLYRYDISMEVDDAG